MDSSPAFLGKSGYFYPGVDFSLARNAAYLPKMTKSSKLLAPSLFAPWTEAQATSPQASNPGTILSFPFASWVITLKMNKINDWILQFYS